MRKIPGILFALLVALLPTRLIRPFARMLGWEIAEGARIGFSLVVADTVFLQPGACIGHFSFIRCRRLLMRGDSRIGHLNRVTGPLSVWLDQDAAIGNLNTVTRADPGVTHGEAQLRLGRLSKLTIAHRIDCTASIVFGDYSTLAGAGSQIWTHGYVHHESGPGRYRVDGRVTVGNNVYLGSRVIITGGVEIADAVMVGVGVTVAKSLREPGYYVSSPLRQLPRPAPPETRNDMEIVAAEGLIETVYRKKHEVV